ncbi:MAG: hypothetical protein JOY64_04355 [Alphaproteobacteria bacterium]|nr:hypothetical protein [Alphaproteobacteria bacterium]MBV8406839.1 hypothetical protein [Alphaproteobacteria bacterium]
MLLQLPLPASWARIIPRRDPQERLTALKADVVEAKARIRAVLDDLAERHGLPAKDIDDAMGYADDMLSDAIYSAERDLEQEIEDRDPV